MPIVEPAALLRLFAAGCLLGAAFAAVYDLLRIVRILFGERAACPVGRLGQLPMPPAARRHIRWGAMRGMLVHFGDLLYFPLFGAAIAVYLSAAYDGRIRWFALAGLALGFFGWRLTLGRLVTAASAAISALLRFLLCWAMWWISRPFVRLGRGVASGFSALGRWLYRPIYTRREMRRCLRRLTRAFSDFEREG
ncbi:MAG: spore cortex biosynthesis protein YabQ [Clostridia bacterium]|nr:spore cortex biosynthesis protein YabQ [Clostridia bacterium]